MNNLLQQKSNRAVAIWILTGVIMLIIQVLLGGVTRLTGSGLSITEWNLVTGTFPPFNEQQWLTEFNKYKQTPQFHLLNSDFALPDFKFIFFWEWFHRLWARMIGVVFLIGFLYLALKKKMKQEMVKPLLILFLLGAMQGAIGWIMVASGLKGDAIYVRPTRLVLHFIFALGLICYACWFALQLLIPSREITRNTGTRIWTWAIIVILLFQLSFGALMAGHKAASVAPTWPMINGDWIPASLFKESPLLLNFIDNKITIHFMHRGLAYLLFILTLIWSVNVYKLTIVSGYFRKSRWLPLFIIFIQIVTGIMTVLVSPGIIPNHWGIFDWLAQVHQLTAMLFLITMVYMLYLVRPVRQQ